jgi:hypothetical protein
MIDRGLQIDNGQWAIGHFGQRLSKGGFTDHGKSLVPSLFRPAEPDSGALESAPQNPPQIRSPIVVGEVDRLLGAKAVLREQHHKAGYTNVQQ